jgi:hypothetical protein
MNNKKVIKQILKEGTENDNITRIAIFDFDGTLVNSPLPEEGMAEYEEKTGEKWPYKGWWGRKESLDMEIFDIQPIRSVLADYRAEKGNPDTLLVMLTGRIQKLALEVEGILSNYGLTFDEYHYNNGGSTLTYKINTLNEILSQHPNVKSIAMWEDRVEHIEPFKAWGNNLKDIDFNITAVEGN